jgi:hypothetical protein
MKDNQRRGKMKIRGVKFEVEDVEWDRDGRLEQFFVYVDGSDQELSDVLAENVLKSIETELYRTHEGANYNEDDPTEDR